MGAFNWQEKENSSLVRVCVHTCVCSQSCLWENRALPLSTQLQHWRSKLRSPLLTTHICQRSHSSTLLLVMSSPQSRQAFSPSSSPLFSFIMCSFKGKEIAKVTKYPELNEGDWSCTVPGWTGRLYRDMIGCLVSKLRDDWLTDSPSMGVLVSGRLAKTTSTYSSCILWREPFRPEGGKRQM